MRVSKFILLTIFLFALPAFAQQNSVVTLQKYISELESRFDVKFSYAVEDIDSIKLENIPTVESIKEAQNYLNTNTPLLYENLNDRYITVSRLNKKITICGILQDAETGEPLTGASIVVKNQPQGTITSSLGAFNLKDVSASAEILISFLGYGQKAISVLDLFNPDEPCKVIKLNQQDYALSEVIVTKFLTTGLQKSVDGKTVLNTQKFGILPGLIEPDILQTIQVLPGVESINESIANINVRGGTHDENQMLWDDITMYHSGHFFGLISAYNPNLTQRVDVSKNGTSSQYGGGVSSTISMYTKDEIPNHIKGGAGINLISGDAFIEIPLSDKLAVHLSGRRSVTDGWNTPTYDEYFRRSFEDSEIRNSENNTSQANSESQFYFYDYTAKLLYDASKKHKFRANFIGIDNKLDYSEHVVTNGEMASKSSQLTQKNMAFGASWQADWNSRFHTKLNTYYTKYNIDANDLRIETDQLLTQQNEVLETGIKLNTFYEIVPNFKWLNGYQFTETGIRNATRVSNPLFNERIKDVLRSHSAYSELEYSQGSTFIRSGARVTYFEEFEKFRVEPRLNIRQKISGQIALKLLGEYKYQTATQIIDFEDDFLGVENRRWILANDEDIPLIQSKQISFGIDFKQNNWYLDATGFYKEVDGITASNQGFQNQFQFLKTTGSYTAKGLEFIINKTTNRFSTWLSYTFSQNDYTFENFIPTSFPNNTDIRHSFTLATNYDILKNLKISAGALYRSGHPYTAPVEGEETVQDGNNRVVNYAKPNAENLDDFVRVDVSAAYNFKISESVNAKFNVGVLNVLDNENILQRYYQVNASDETKAVEINKNSLGITPNASFRISF